MSQFAEFLNKKLLKRGWRPARLAREAKLDPSLVSKCLRDVRPFTAESVVRLRALLCDTDEERVEFDRVYEETPKRRKHNLYHDLSTDSAVSEIHVASLLYHPFSGNEGFLDKCLIKMMELSFIRVVMEKNLAGTLPGQPAFERFSMKDRTEWVESGKVDLLFNMVSLQRMKKLEFLISPIRIGINGVLLRKQAHRIEEAVRLLAIGIQPETDPFKVLVGRDEVGGVYMQASNRLCDISKAPQAIDGIRRDDPQYCLVFVESINPLYLARQLRATEGKPALLVCDEHTALNVLRELEGDGMLVVSPNSDQSVIRDLDRRALPAWYYGIGLRRQFNNPLVEFLRQNTRTFLAAEPENIASWYEDCYVTLVRDLTACLSQTGIFIGGLIRTNARVGDDPPPGAHSGTWKGVRKTMVEQNARAVALRCLNLSRRLLRNLPSELQAWRPILERTRERLQITESGDRGRLRYILLYCAKMTLCEDPLSPIPDPIELLRRLVPSYSLAPGDGPLVKINNDTERPYDYWIEYLRILARELDTDLTALENCPEKEFRSSADLGRIISRIQRLLEFSKETEALVSVRRYTTADEKPFLKLRKQYQSERDLSLQDSDLTRDLDNQEQGLPLRFIAYSLGYPVGFIEGNVEHVTHFGSLSEAPVGALQIRHLHVETHTHKAGVSRRLIRRMIEEANAGDCRWVWIYKWDVENKKGQEDVDREKYERAGFVRFPENQPTHRYPRYELLRYELLRESGPKRFYPEHMRPLD